MFIKQIKFPLKQFRSYIAESIHTITNIDRFWFKMDELLFQRLPANLMVLFFLVKFSNRTQKIFENNVALLFENNVQGNLGNDFVASVKLSIQ